MQPHKTLPTHLHPVINVGVLLSGSLTVYSEDKKQSLHLKANTPNNSIIEMVNQYHYGANEGDSPAKIIVFYIAEKGQKVTIKRKVMMCVYQKPTASAIVVV
ncbi:cupin domain-containing protein [Vibrio sp. Vb339]|uniref:cupin domain-containing protein n=1 Tax=Vibrio sp. Vb339 TaxID=1192013 RepID=UPI00265742B4|nr:cupin domain-containing protein [Vibrio sp. Vb339]